MEEGVKRLCHNHDEEGFRQGFAQVGLKLRHLTTCPVLQWKWFFVNDDTVSLLREDF
jgi:hypothetical protein